MNTVPALVCVKHQEIHVLHDMIVITYVEELQQIYDVGVMLQDDLMDVVHEYPKTAKVYVDEPVCVRRTHDNYDPLGHVLWRVVGVLVPHAMYASVMMARW
jgi:hypothetical protein